MCTGACSKFIAIPLYILALVSIICNILLLFPAFESRFVAADTVDKPRITSEVKYMGGVVGGGILVLIPAIHIHLTAAKGCCANRCGMFLSIGFAAAGVAGALYSMTVSALGLSNGPLCALVKDDTLSDLGLWGTPFANSSGTYLNDKALWSQCKLPEGVVEFNVILFSILLAAAALELVLCAIQMVNGLFGCLCGTCSSSEE